MSTVTRPLPSPLDLTGQFYRHLAQGSLRLQRCETCNTYRHIPREMCPTCYSDQWEWARCSGRGEVHTWTTTVRALHPAFTDTPFVLATVTMEEGPRLLGRLIDVPPELIRVGLPVQVELSVIAPEIGILGFRSRSAT
jgi:uncharacterized protein